MIGLDGIGFHAVGEMFLGVEDIGYLPVSKATGNTINKFKTRNDYPIPVPTTGSDILWDDDTLIVWDDDSEILFDV